MSIQRGAYQAPWSTITTLWFDTIMAESQPSWIQSAPKLSISRVVLKVSAVNSGKIHKFWDSLPTKLDYTKTDRQNWVHTQPHGWRLINIGRGCRWKLLLTCSAHVHRITYKNVTDRQNDRLTKCHSIFVALCLACRTVIMENRSCVKPY